MPDILECEVKQALESITMNKASGGDGIPIELFQILKDGAVKVLHSICFGNSAVATGLEKVSFHSNPRERQCQRMFEVPYNCTHVSHASWRRKWQPTLVFLPGKSHVWRNLVGYSSWGRKESDMTERLHFHFHMLVRLCSKTFKLGFKST